MGGGVEVSTRCKLGNITFTEIIRVKCEDVPRELAHCRHLLRRASSHENRKINEKHRHSCSDSMLLMTTTSSLLLAIPDTVIIVSLTC